MNYTEIFKDIYNILIETTDEGEVASYIPELQKIDPKKFGVNLCTTADKNYSFGDNNEKFSIQSIAKVLSLSMAYKLEGEELWSRVGVEPSGTPFNSLILLELDKGIPRNPFINAGALVIADILISNLKDPKKDFLEYVRKLSGNPNIEYSNKVAQSEKKHAYRNAALINLMKAFDNINNDIDIVMDFYFHLCSIEMSCTELSKTFIFLASQGFNPNKKEQVISPSRTKRINAIMQLCGFYDEAGEFSYKVGLPGKSGVGGGIIAIHPNKYAIAVWSPKLNKKGNSNLGIKFLEMFTSKIETSIF